METIIKQSYTPFSKTLSYHYDKDEYSIFPRNIKKSVSSNSLIINNLNIRLNEKAKFLYIDGISPQINWIYTVIKDFNTTCNDVYYQGVLTPGVDIRINKPLESWQTYYDNEKKLLLVGEVSPFRVIEFSLNSFIGIDLMSNIVSLSMKIENVI